MRRAGGAALLLLLTFGAGARSQPAVTRLSVGPDRSTLEALRAALAEGAQAIAEDGVARLLRVESHFPPRSPRGEALAAELRDATAAALEGAAREGGAELLLDLSADDRELRVALVPRAAEVSWWRAFFFRPARTRRWRVPLDAELRTFVDRRPTASRSALEVRSARLPAGEVLAVGTIEGHAGETALLLLVGADSVSLFRLSDGRGDRARAALVGRAERPAGSAPGVGSRRAFATLRIEGPSAFVQWRDRIEGYQLRWAPLRLEVVSDRQCPALAHRWPDACAEPVDGRDYFASALLPREGRPAPRTAPSSFYARWRSLVRRSDGSVADVEVVVNPRGRLVATTDGREIGLQGHGSALGAGDIDADGRVELLVSGPEEDGARDTLELLRLQADGGLRRLWSQEVPGQVAVAGAGDLEGDGVPTLFAVARAEGRNTLWMVGGPP